MWMGIVASAVWVDEYGPGVVHVHCVLDLLHTPPRRGFDPAHLQAAWEERWSPGSGIGADLSASQVVPILEGVRSTAAVAMGSERFPAPGYVVVDSVRPRAPLPTTQVKSVDVPGGESALRSSSIGTFPSVEVGWLVPPPRAAQEREFRRLACPAGHRGAGEGDEEANRRIAARFLVARLVRGLIEEEFAVELESVLYRASRCAA